MIAGSRTKPIPLSKQTRAPGPRESRKTYAATKGSTLPVSSTAAMSAVKSSPQLRRRKTRTKATRPVIPATRSIASLPVRRAFAASPSPSALPASVPAASENPYWNMKATTIVFETMGNTSSSMQPAPLSPSHSRPAKKRFVSQPHHSLSIMMPAGRDIRSISPQPSRAAPSRHRDQASALGSARWASAHVARAWTALASVSASGAPGKPSHRMSMGKRATFSTLAAMLTAIGVTMTRCATR
mmetsp:Transcript_4014/g.11202  ORF Transcript_4014/g.11202 Transcript_4014/m.11202 type:complete len:242 (+) Transcript_4014:651-1376(+)